MKILITGSQGQLGRALIKLKPTSAKVFAMDRTNFDMLDIPKCLKTIKFINPDWIINCGAFTNVDMAESNKEIVMNVNYNAPKAFAKEIKELGGKFLQISTDYVFDGERPNKKPYTTNDKKSPLGIYGLSKAKAEDSIADIFYGTNQGIILRTSWLMGPYGKNFLLTILNLHLIKKKIEVVKDQIGSPTSVYSLAEVCWKIVELNNLEMIFQNNINGILHWQDNGQTNWYEIALNISNIAKVTGLIKSDTEIIPINTFDFPTKARRPFFSVLDCNYTKKILNHKGIEWRYGLKKIMEQIYLDTNNQFSLNPNYKI